MSETTNRKPISATICAGLIFFLGALWAWFFWPPQHKMLIAGYVLWGVTGVRALFPTSRVYRRVLWMLSTFWYGFCCLALFFGGFVALMFNPLLGNALFCWVLTLFPMSIVLWFADRPGKPDQEEYL